MTKEKTKLNVRKIIKNALINESLVKFTRQEKHEMIKEILDNENIGQRELARQLDIPHSTIHDWYSLRQEDKGTNSHISLSRMVLYLRTVDIDKITDWGRIEQMKELCEELLQKRK
jgi:DNA-binding transcriptional regulator YiaG